MMKQQRNNKSSNSKKSDGAVSVGGDRTGITRNVTRTLFPIKTTKTLHYHETVSLSSTSGAVATYVLSANGLYDPNITGTGHQPAGFDQVMLFYHHYYVNSSTINVNVRNNTSNVSPTCILSVNGSNTPITNTYELQEDGSNVAVKLGPPILDASMATLRAKCNIGKFGGVKDQSSSTSYQGDSGANPAEQSYFHVSFWDDEKAGTADCYLDILISFTATFIEPRDVAPSLVEKMFKMVTDQEKAQETSARVRKVVPDEGKGLAPIPSVLCKGQKWVLVADPDSRS